MACYLTLLPIRSFLTVLLVIETSFMALSDNVIIVIVKNAWNRIRRTVLKRTLNPSCDIDFKGIARIINSEGYEWFSALYTHFNWPMLPRSMNGLGVMCRMICSSASLKALTSISPLAYLRRLLDRGNADLVSRPKPQTQH